MSVVLETLQASIHEGEAAPSLSKVTKEDEPLVRNFRQAAGLQRIYRCANTDPLGKLFQSTSDDDKDTAEQKAFDKNLNSSEEILLHKAGLILDLRSNSERNETLAQAWMSQAPGGKLITKYFSRDVKTTNYNIADTSERSVYRIDVLSPKRLFDHLGENWLTSPVQKAQYAFSLAFDTQKLHEMRMDILNGKGLQGTYEAILCTSGEELFAALKAITEYLENNQTGDIAIHCVQGKDRTGLIVMLCQSILGIDDATIVQDYHKSEKLLKKREESAAVTTIAKTQFKGKINKSFFSGSPEEAMISTIAFIKERHGSFEGYLDFIGFGESWRNRFTAVISMGGDFRSNL